MIRLLGEKFIPVGMDCEQTERRGANDALRKFFEKVVNQRDLKYFVQRPAYVTQGYYVFDHTGKLLSAANHEYLDEKLARLVTMLEEGHKRHQAKPSGGKQERPKTRPYQPPAGTLVARGYCRIHPLPLGARPINRLVGLDFLWIPRREVKALLAGRFPESLTRRLALGHLRDNVRGEPRYLRWRDVKLTTFGAVPRRVGKQIRVYFGGRFKIEAPAMAEQRSEIRSENGETLEASGFVGKLEGELFYDTGTDEVTRFLLYASGQAWGKHSHTPGAPDGKFPLKIGYELVPEDARPDIPLVPPFAAGFEGNIRKYLEKGTPCR